MDILFTLKLFCIKFRWKCVQRDHTKTLTFNLHQKIDNKINQST